MKNILDKNYIKIYFYNVVKYLLFDDCLCFVYCVVFYNLFYFLIVEMDIINIM